MHDPKPLRQSTSAAAQWAPLARFIAGSWFLLLIISYALVAIVNRPQPFDELQPAKA